MIEIKNESGIHSLGGFSFQIRAFLYYLLNLNVNEEMEFEAIEDISVSKIESSNIDDANTSFVNKIKKGSSYQAIQVKRTKVNKSVATKVLYNWLIIEIQDISVDKYTLLTIDTETDTQIINNLEKEDLYKKLSASTKKEKSNEGILRDFFSNDVDKFEMYFTRVIEKHDIIKIDNIDKEIYERCELLFKKHGVNITTYNTRVEELLSHITVKIINRIYEKKSYKVSYNEFMKEAENISNRITDKEIDLDYSEFKENNPVDLEGLSITSSRQYKQLLTCEFSNGLVVKDYLTKSMYYKQYRYLNMERNKTRPIDDIEITTHENFELIKDRLKYKKEDTPRKRLERTIEEENSYAKNTQIKHGVCIHLTNDNSGKNQISWKDE